MKVKVWTRKPAYRYEWCGRKVYAMADHLPRCLALGRPKG